VRSLVLGLGIVVIALAWIACSSASDPPLGGPFGGTASNTPPAGTPLSQGTDAGAVSDDAGSVSPSDDAGADANGGGCIPNTSSNGTGAGSGSSGDGGAPTWSALYKGYFAYGAIGNCGDSVCHAQAGTASGMYQWLLSENNSSYCGCPNCLASLGSTTTSVLSWFGGAMPLLGPTSDSQAASDVEAWVAAGSKNN